MSASEQLASVTPLPGFAKVLPLIEQLDATVAAELNDYTISIDDAYPSESRQFEASQQTDWHYRMSDGSHYTARLTEARNQTFDTLLSHRTPWCTDLNGLYTKVDQEHARRGSSGVRVGPEQTSLARAARNLAVVAFGKETQLAHDSYVHHVVLDHIDGLGLALPKQVIDDGDSRGAMTNLAVQAYAGRFDRIMSYNDQTDPCIEHAVNVGWQTPGQLPKIAKYLGVEVVELAAALMDYEHQELLPIARTARFSPAFWLQQVSTGYALFKGEAGNFVDHIPNDSTTAIGLFTGSDLNHADDWTRRLANFENIYTYRQPGSHLSIARWDVQLRTINRIELAQEQLMTVRQPGELDAAMIVRNASGSVVKLSA